MTMNEGSNRDEAKRWARVILWGDVTKSIMAVFAALCVAGSAVWWLAEDKILSYVSERLSPSLGGPCTVIPAVGHAVEAGAPGQWGEVVWRGVTRLREDCGRPNVIGVISNGGGFLHDAPLSISGVALPLGSHDLPYRFYTSKQIEPGRGTFHVIVTFPDAIGGAPPVISPRLSIVIPEPDPTKTGE